MKNLSRDQFKILETLLLLLKKLGMMTEITFLKKALPGGSKSWQRPVHLNRGLSEKKKHNGRRKS